MSSELTQGQWALIGCRLLWRRTAPGQIGGPGGRHLDTRWPVRRVDGGQCSWLGLRDLRGRVPLGRHPEIVDSARRLLRLLAESWTEILPGIQLHDQAIRGLSVHELRAADSLQLAAALVWSGNNPVDHQLVCLDDRLRSAARKEGLTVLPE